MTKGAKTLAKLFDRPKQYEVAKQLGIGQSHLSLIIAGKRVPSLALAAKIRRELGIPVDFWTA